MTKAINTIKDKSAILTIAAIWAVAFAFPLAALTFSITIR